MGLVYDGDNLDAFEGGGGALPELPVLVEAELTGEAPEAVQTDMLVYELEEPVRVDEPGRLWVAYELLDGDGEMIACVLGCVGSNFVPNEDPAWAWHAMGNGWGTSPGWNQYEDERADVRVTIAY